MSFISEQDSPGLLKTLVNGKPGFMLMPDGDDHGEGIYFESGEALKSWAEKVFDLAQSPQSAPTYEEWLDPFEDWTPVFEGFSNAHH